jgi:acid phosphatase type 7
VRTFLARLVLPAVALSAGLSAAGAATFNIAEADLPKPLMLIAYGDMRFTDPSETGAANPGARQALIAKVAAEQPAAIFINGDVPWHGTASDYAVYRGETRVWRELHLRIYPALGNHEFAGCWESACLDHWWRAFPELSGRRWYSVALGDRVLGVVLDSASSLMPGSEQRAWLQKELAALAASVRFVLIVLHHPPLADLQTVKLVDHNPRPNELALADYLGTIAGHTRARFVVSAGHIHNYERLERDGVVYLVSGGGGATPYQIDRTSADLYQGTDFPNFHYVRFELRAHTLAAEMIRLGQSAAPRTDTWEIRDRFELTLPP